MRQGLKYDQAVVAYDAMCNVFEDAIVSGSRVNIGRVGCLDPEVMEPRTVNMGFSRKGGNVEKVSRQYFIGRRLRYRFKIFKKFMETHELGWFNPED